jgi:hypothetical protein
MPALIIFGLRLLRWAVYVEAAVIVLLLIAGVWVCANANRWYELCQAARAERDDARAMLDALRRMSEIRRRAADRMARAGKRSWPP